MQSPYRSPLLSHRAPDKPYLLLFPAALPKVPHYQNQAPLMKVRPPKKSGKKDGIKSEMWNDVQLQYGKLLLEKRHPVLKRYLEREIRIRTDILKSIEKKDSQKIQVRKRQLEEELNIAEKGMEYYA